MKVVVMDMHGPYRAVVEECLPKAEIVADKMHVMRLVNRALDKVRLRIQGQGKKKNRELYEGRYVLLRNPEGLNEEEKHQLNKVLRDYPKLRRAWKLKEEFCRWYRRADRRGAWLELKAWECEVEAGGPVEYRGVLKTLSRWREQILNYFRYRVTNGFLEGSNNSSGFFRKKRANFDNSARSN